MKVTASVNNVDSDLMTIWLKMGSMGGKKKNIYIKINKNNNLYSVYVFIFK